MFLFLTKARLRNNSNYAKDVHIEVPTLLFKRQNISANWATWTLCCFAYNYVVGNSFSHVIFSFLLLSWMFSFVLHTLPSITTKEKNCLQH